MKLLRNLAFASIAAFVLPAFAGGPTQGPVQAPAQAPSKAAMTGQAPAVAMQSNTRRAYSYEPTTAPATDRRGYSYQPGTATGYNSRRIYTPRDFSRTESIKSAAFKSVQQYG